MIINGKEVNIDYRAAQTIQQHLDVSPEIPETAKVEVSKKDIKELNQTFDSGVANYNEALMYGNMYGTENQLLTGLNASENRANYYQVFD